MIEALPHSGSPTVVGEFSATAAALEVSPQAESIADQIIESARRQIETTREAGCYTLPSNSSNIPARNPRLNPEK